MLQVQVMENRRVVSREKTADDRKQMLRTCVGNTTIFFQRYLEKMGLTLLGQDVTQRLTGTSCAPSQIVGPGC